MPNRDLQEASLWSRGLNQHHLLSRKQVLGCGVSASTLTRMTRAGRLVRLHRGIYRLRGSESTPAQRALAAVMAVGGDAVASFSTAAGLYGLLGTNATEIHVSTARPGATGLPGVKVHVAALAPMDRTSINHVPVTSVARTLMDLGSITHIDDVEDALEEALRRRMVSPARLRWYLQNRAGRGRRGVATLRRLMKDRPSGTEAVESPLELRTLRFLRAEGLPPPERQLVITREGQFIARVDFAYPERRLLIEVDGYRYHSGRGVWLDDIRKRNELMSLGYFLVIVTDDSLRHHQKRLAAQLHAFF